MKKKFIFLIPVIFALMIGLGCSVKSPQITLAPQQETKDVVEKGVAGMGSLDQPVWEHTESASKEEQEKDAELQTKKSDLRVSFSVGNFHTDKIGYQGSFDFGHRLNFGTYFQLSVKGFKNEFFERYSWAGGIGQEFLKSRGLGIFCFADFSLLEKHVFFQLTPTIRIRIKNFWIYAYYAFTMTDPVVIAVNDEDLLFDEATGTYYYTQEVLEALDHWGVQVSLVPLKAVRFFGGFTGIKGKNYSLNAGLDFQITTRLAIGASARYYHLDDIELEGVDKNWGIALNLTYFVTGAPNKRFRQTYLKEGDEVLPAEIIQRPDMPIEKRIEKVTVDKSDCFKAEITNLQPEYCQDQEAEPSVKTTPPGDYSYHWTVVLPNGETVIYNTQTFNIKFNLLGTYCFEVLAIDNENPDCEQKDCFCVIVKKCDGDCKPAYIIKYTVNGVDACGNNTFLVTTGEPITVYWKTYLGDPQGKTWFRGSEVNAEDTVTYPNGLPNGTNLLLEVKNQCGNDKCQITITDEECDEVVVDIKANGFDGTIEVNVNEEFTISWSSSEADSVEVRDYNATIISTDFNGSLPKQISTPGTYKYWIDGKNECSDDYDEVTVIVKDCNACPELHFHQEGDSIVISKPNLPVGNITIEDVITNPAECDAKGAKIYWKVEDQHSGSLYADNTISLPDLSPGIHSFTWKFYYSSKTAELYIDGNWYTSVSIASMNHVQCTKLKATLRIICD